MTQHYLSRFDTMTEDARAFLVAFCARFPPGTVAVSEHSEDRQPPSLWFELTPQRPGSLAVSVTVDDGDPTVVLGFGRDERQEVFEWMADLDTYDRSWWQVKVEPLLTAIAAGLVTHRIWERGGRIVAVPTSVQGPEPFEVFSRKGIRGFLGGLAGTLNRSTDPSRIIRYPPWSDPAQ